MSYAEVWVVRPNGDIEKYQEVENGSAGALYIWMCCLPLLESSFALEVVLTRYSY
jgi:hypothetical protein